MSSTELLIHSCADNLGPSLFSLLRLHFQSKHDSLTLKPSKWKESRKLSRRKLDSWMIEAWKGLNTLQEIRGLPRATNIPSTTLTSSSNHSPILPLRNFHCLYHICAIFRSSCHSTSFLSSSSSQSWTLSFSRLIIVLPALPFPFLVPTLPKSLNFSGRIDQLSRRTIPSRKILSTSIRVQWVHKTHIPPPPLNFEFAYMRFHGGKRGDGIEKGEGDNGNFVVNRSKSVVSFSGLEGMDEYTAVQRYVTSYRTQELYRRIIRPAAKGSFLPSQTYRSGTVPENWLDTDIHQGISIADAGVGCNKITAEKENILKKFLGYFTRPILEGLISSNVNLSRSANMDEVVKIATLFAGLSLEGRYAMKATVIEMARSIPGAIVRRTLMSYRRLAAFDTSSSKKAKQYQLMLTLLTDDEEDSENPVLQGHAIVATDQSAVPGESLAIGKYMGEVGESISFPVIESVLEANPIASLVEGAIAQEHFKAIMNSIRTLLLVLVVFWTMVAWIRGFFRRLKIATPSNGSANLLNYALIFLIVGVLAFEKGKRSQTLTKPSLPVATTTTLAVGAAYLAKQKAIVQKPTVIESLAGVDVLCSDKTGILAANQLSIRGLYVAEGQDVNWMMAVAALASSYNLKSLDLIDKHTRFWGKAGRLKHLLPSIQFSNVSRPYITWAATNTSVQRELRKPFSTFQFSSYQFCPKRLQVPWGCIPKRRRTTAQTIVETQQLRVLVKMLTGDAIANSNETGKILSLGMKVYNSQKLIHGGLRYIATLFQLIPKIGTTQHDFVERVDGLAEVFPEHKYHVVEMPQQRGHLTAMTRDGKLMPSQPSVRIVLTLGTWVIRGTTYLLTGDIMRNFGSNWLIFLQLLQFSRSLDDSPVRCGYLNLFAGVTIVIAVAKDRSRKDPSIENMIVVLSKCAVEHEMNKNGREKYVLATRAVEGEGEEEDYLGPVIYGRSWDDFRIFILPYIIYIDIKDLMTDTRKHPETFLVEASSLKERNIQILDSRIYPDHILTHPLNKFSPPKHPSSAS
ncbi:uncharacterized protein BDR25DRAFT_354488 [Lindgomyces ingoldianus]|uniref:Uncharacterized protein n=1 Tax=Lindgomyces ingoldianus TaxID=673940 RepID=A0ACB6QYF5_9PLEO|nr:uncharacterized protein BDR25DRAFT_354488 [Lindgomyces ingoldianus]KAF2471231.1 hypothetical protein BDR25DRAFT_354488 [Lindgomyces ingoldianus]